MLDEWLTLSKRDSGSFSGFEVLDATEIADLSENVKSHLIELLQASMIDPDFLRAIEARVGWRKRQALFAWRIPTTGSVKRGDFGEVLTSAILEQFHDYEIPVRKLRFKLAANQTLPATDVLALKIDANGQVNEVCYVECKLRITRDTYVAVNGSKQLRDDFAAEYPAILAFVAGELHKQGDGDPLFESFCSYLEDREDNRDKDTYRLSICCERTVWRDEWLGYLEDDSEAQPDPLSVQVTLIHNLKDVSDNLFREIGFEEVFDED